MADTKQAPAPAPPSEGVRMSRAHTVADSPAGVSHATSEGVRAASSHTAVESPGGGDGVQTEPRYEPPPRATNHTSGETPGALDARAMARRMNAQRPAPRVRDADVLRGGLAAHRQRVREGRG